MHSCLCAVDNDAPLVRLGAHSAVSTASVTACTRDQKQHLAGWWSVDAQASRDRRELRLESACKAKKICFACYIRCSLTTHTWRSQRYTMLIHVR